MSIHQQTLSLRTRVLLGALLWTIGLVVLSFVIIAAVAMVHQI